MKQKGWMILPTKREGHPALFVFWWNLFESGSAMSRWLNEKQVAEKTGLSLSKLRNDRSLGQGFPYSKWGRNVRYREEDIDRFLEATLVVPGSRSRPGGGRR